MRKNIQMVLLSFFLAIIARAQHDLTVSLNIGDDAPPLRIKEWLKGGPVDRLEKGQVYVLEFWATWCAPCRAAMPRLSVLAGKYRKKVTFIGVDVYEQEAISPRNIKAFVDSMGNRMNYLVAAEDSNFMATGWLNATGISGIPSTIVVDAAGKVAWIGHPAQLEAHLDKIINGNWDLQKELARRTEAMYLDSLDREVFYRLLPYLGSPLRNEKAKPELALLAINSIVIKEPRLKYTPTVAYETMAALLQTDMPKAYLFAKEAMAAPVYTSLVYDRVVDVVKTYMDTLPISREIYELAAEAWQKLIDLYPYPEMLDMGYEYAGMAEYYARANNKPKAIRGMQKAIGALKSQKNFSSEHLAAYQSQLRKYKDR